MDFFDDNEGTEDDQPAARRSNWSPVPFGKYAGFTLPWILFHDPSYIVWLVDEADIVGNLAGELRRIYQMAQHIRPPEWLRDTHEFAVIVDRRGVFIRFRLFERGKRSDINLPVGHKIYGISAKLDVTVPTRCKDNWDGFENMSKYLIKMFLGRNKVSAEGCEKFF